MTDIRRAMFEIHIFTYTKIGVIPTMSAHRNKDVSVSWCLEGEVSWCDFDLVLSFIQFGIYNFALVCRWSFGIVLWEIATYGK